MKKVYFFLLSFALILQLSSMSWAQCIFQTQTFTSNPVLAATNTTGAWYPDRYAPNGFVADAGRLKISINGPADGAQVRPAAFSSSFYNTQGRKFNQCGACVTSFKGDLFIPSDWATKKRRTDMWATALDVTNTVSAYPIIGFRNVDGTSPGIYYYDFNGAGAWVNTGVSISYNTSYTLEFRISGSNVEYLVNNSVVGTIASGGSVYFSDIIMQAYNFNDNTLGASYDPTADNSYDAFWDNLVIAVPGVKNTTTLEQFCTIQAAINDADTQPGHTIEISSGTYNEQVLVTKGVKLLGVGATQPIINFTGTVTGKKTLFDISVDAVTVENIHFNVDLANLKSAIIASGAGIDNITVKNNLIDAYGTPSSGTYGDRNAVSINYGGPTNFRVASGGVDNITFTGNTVNGTLPGSFFRAAVAVDEGGGTFTNNTSQTINHDVIVRFGGNGNITISNNNCNGGGIEVDDMNAGAGTINVTNNQFNATFANTSAPNTAVLRLRNNYTFRPTNVSGNTFTNHQWAVSLENYNTVTVDNNSFTPLANSTTYRHITVNTKDITSGSGFYPPIIGLTLTRNTFNGSGTAGGTGVAFYNHDNDSPTFGTFTIGTSGNENNFNAGIGTFIYLDNSVGSTNPAPPAFPEYTGIGATTMACWATNMDIPNNKFDVGAGLQLPSAMNLSQRTALEGKLNHKPDFACKGLLSFYFPVHNVTQNTYHATIQLAIDAATTVNGDVISVPAGTYDEDVVVNKSLTINGAGIDVSYVVGPIGGGGATFQVSAAGVVINGFTISRAGNNTTDWNNAGLNSAGISIQSQGITAEIKNNKITGNRTGIDVNNSNGNNIHNNIITSNRTGLIFRNQTDNTTLIQNEITDNWTVGIVFLDASGGTNSPAQTAASSSFNNNKITGNWYGGIVDRQSGGSLPAPGTNLKNFSCNWFGSTSPVITTANSTEPGYSAQIPVAYGGSATNPGGAPDIAGPASANIAYILFLTNGTDNDGATIGFQPVPGSCNGCPGGGLVTNTNTGELFCSIQAAIDDAQTLPGHTITVAAGTYNEAVNITKAGLTIQGASRTTTIIKAPCSGTNFTVNFAAANVTLKNLTVTRNFSTIGDWYACGNNNGILIASNATGTTVDNVLVTGNRNGIAIESPNTTVQNSIIEANRTGIHMYTNFAGSIIRNNFVRNNFTHGILFNFENGGNLIATNVLVNNNSITGNWISQVNFKNTNSSTYGDMTGLSFSCNWYGTANPTINNSSPADPPYNMQTPSQFGGMAPAPGAELTGSLSGLIPYTPYLTLGTDNDGVTDGFQPLPNNCVGCPGGGFVTNTTTNKTYCSIQAAINDPQTLPGHTLTIAAGTYNESINITKSLTLLGAQANICATTTRAGAESIISCTNGIGINASNVIINGFTIKDQTSTNSAPGFGYAVYMAPTYTGTQLLNNIIKNNVVGSSLANTGATQVQIKCNWFDSNNNAGPASGVGIYTDEYVGGIVSNVLIDNNKFTGHTNDGGIDISVSTPAKAATGITITNNVFSGNRRAAFLYNTVSSSFTNNVISGSTGAGTGELRIFGGVNNLSVMNNSFSAGTPQGIRITDDGAGATNSNITVSQNSFTGYSGANFAIANVSGYSGALPATCNWFGITGPGIAALVSGSVTYDPSLNNGTDNDIAIGFQPVPGSCVGCSVGPATISPTTSICSGTATTITFTGAPNSTVTYNINGGSNLQIGLDGAGNASLPTGILTSTTTYNLVSVTNGICTNPLSGSAIITTTVQSISLTSAAATESQITCLNAPITAITYALGSGASGANVTGLPTGITATVNGNILTISGSAAITGTFNYSIVTTGNACPTATESGTIIVNPKPVVTLTVNGQTFNEGNNSVLCDTDANPVNTLFPNVTTTCIAGAVVWRTKIGAGDWSSWSTTAPSSQPSDNTAYQYQAACEGLCPATVTNSISLTINYRASTPQNVSLVADGTTVAAGESKTVCDIAGNTIVFNATCAAGEILLYSVDGGDYSTTVPSQIVDGNFHNYRVRCRKADNTPSCVETESAVMSLKISTAPAAPTVSISPTDGCGAPVAFSGSSSCGSLTTIWYNATTNQPLASLPATTPNATTSFYARCQNEAGCLSGNSNTVTYTVTPVNDAPVITVSNDMVCTGTQVTISANCPPGSTAFWNTGVNENSFTVAFNNVTTQTYWAKCIFPNGCQSPESLHKSVLWKAFDLTFINIGQSQSGTKPANDRALWASQFITKDAGPVLEQSTESNPTIFYSENVNKTAPRFWTIQAETCALGTDGSLTFDMLANPEVGIVRSYNTHENNAPYLMYANREGWTELYAQNHPAYGFYQDNGSGGNTYDEGLPKGLYKLGVRYWDQKGQGSIYPATRQPAGNVLAYQEYWFRIQSQNGIGTGATRTAADLDPAGMTNGFAQVMPNPVSNTLRLKVTEAKGQKVSVNMLDASGRTLVQRTFVPETDQHQEEFEVSHLSNGMYFLQVNTSEKQSTLKVVKVQ